MTYTFDCVNKIVQINSIGVLDMFDLYSRWKDEVLSTAFGCDQLFRVIKEPLAGSTFVGPYYFIMNDWQIRPLDTPHELIVDGTVVQDATSSLPSFKLDDLSNPVSVSRQVAVEVQVVETPTSGLTPDEKEKLDVILANSSLTHFR
jgi:hypothetical protein